MRYYKLRIDGFYPPEYRERLYEALTKEQEVGALDYYPIIEETAPPPEMIKDIIQVLAPHFDDIENSL